MQGIVKDANAGLPAGSVVSAVSIMELMVGALRADSDARWMAREYFAQEVAARYGVLPFGESETRQAALIFVHLRRDGRAEGPRAPHAQRRRIRARPGPHPPARPARRAGALTPDTTTGVQCRLWMVSTFPR